MIMMVGMTMMTVVILNIEIATSNTNNASTTSTKMRTLPVLLPAH
jgi:hypothetical protein